MQFTDINVRDARWNKLAQELKNAIEDLNKLLDFCSGSVVETAIDIRSALETSLLALPGYSTIDKELIAEIKAKIEKISIYNSNPTASRPLTFILTAEPGSGKSYFTKCISEECDMPMVNANVASLENISELGYWIDELRDHKTQDKIPLLLIDEADSKPEGLPTYLALLWDGTFSWQGRNLKIGKCVIILAVSNEELRTYVEDGKNEKEVKNNFPKVEDLLSRINGGLIKIPPIDERRLDKLCIAIELIKRKFPGVTGIQIPFLKLLVNTRFLHSIRSMETLIEAFPNLSEDSLLKVDDEFSTTLIEYFLKKESFRKNLFAFHLDQNERVNAKQIWTEYRTSSAIVKV